MTKKIKINEKIIYLILGGIILVLSSFIVYATPSDIGHSINEIEWGNQIINHLQVQDMILTNLIMITDLESIFPDGFHAKIVSAKDIFVDTIFISPNIRAHEFYLGSDYAASSFISDWDNLSSNDNYGLWMSYEADPIKIDWNENLFEWDAGGIMYGESHQINPACDADYAGHRRYKVVGALPNAEWQDTICSWNGVGYTWAGAWGKTNPDLTYDVYINNYYTYPRGVGDYSLYTHPTKLLFRTSDGECYDCGPDNSDNWVCETSLHSTC